MPLSLDRTSIGKWCESVRVIMQTPTIMIRHPPPLIVHAQARGSKLSKLCCGTRLCFLISHRASVLDLVFGVWQSEFKLVNDLVSPAKEGFTACPSLMARFPQSSESQGEQVSPLPGSLIANWSTSTFPRLSRERSHEHLQWSPESSGSGIRSGAGKSTTLPL